MKHFEIFAMTLKVHASCYCAIGCQSRIKHVTKKVQDFDR